MYRQLAFLAAASLLAGACAEVGTHARAGDAALPEPRAEALWDHLEQAAYRANWAFWPGKSAFYSGTEPHGMLLTTYVNPAARQALTEGSGPLPPGAIIVKENYKPNKELAAVTVMYKAPQGYDPAHNDWFWLKRLPDGQVEASGRVQSCQACHQAAARDFLMTPVGR